MPKLNELQDRPDGIVLPNQLIAIADPATGEMYKLPLNIVLGITDITKPDPTKQILRFWKGPDDYFDIDFSGASPGGGGAASRFGIEDNTSDVDRSVNMGNSSMNLNAIANFNLNFPNSYLNLNDTRLDQLITDGATNTYIGSLLANGVLRNYATDYAAGNSRYLELTPSSARITYIEGNSITGEHNIATSVNNAFADATGNITLSKGEFADNAAALAGGLITGDVYRTGDLLKIVH